MTERPEKDREETTPLYDVEEEGEEEETEERGTLASADEGSDLDDPREEEGWTQPESSAQKGAPRDEG